MARCDPNKYFITLIQGDSLDKRYVVEDREGNRVGNDVVQRIIFTCAAHGLEQELTYDEAELTWMLSLSSDTTAQLTPRVTGYDLTLLFVGDLTGQAVKTKVYTATMTVKPKRNKIS